MKSPSTPARIALTGTRTFLGERLIQALEEDPACEHILALDIAPPRVGRTKTRFVRLDLTDPTADEQLAAVLRADGVSMLAHLAFLAYPSHSRSWAHELEAIGSLYVMNAAAEVKLDSLVVASSTAVYGASPSNPNFLTEEAPLRGAKGSRWVMDRVAVERDLARLQRDCPAMNIASLRMGMTLGPTIRNAYTKIFSGLTLPMVVGYDPLMQFLHQEDAVGALLHAVRTQAKGNFNIVGEGALYLSDVRRLGGKIALPILPRLGYAASDFLFGLELAALPGAFLDYFRYSWVCDDRKMREQLGFSPNFSSRATLDDFFYALEQSSAALTQRG